MTIGLAIIWIFPFPIDFVILVLILISINISSKKALFKRLGRRPNETHVKGWRGLFESLFQSWASSPAHGNRKGDDSLVKYYCMSCGKENNWIACSKCGSKMKRAN
jgi:hypothetical protein